MSGIPLDTVWTPEVMEYFLKLAGARENFSYLEIAKRLSRRFGRDFSKNSCIGKGRRMNLPPREPRPYVTRPVRPRVRIPDHPGVPLSELDLYRECKFVLGNFEDRPPYQYCGRPVLQDGGSWCERHYNKVFTRRNG